MDLPRGIARAVIDVLVDREIPEHEPAQVTTFLQNLGEAMDTAQADAGDDETKIEDVDFPIRIIGGELP
jgi:hypothetical protein